MASGGGRVTIQLVEEEAGVGAGGPQLFRGQSYEAIRAACLDSGILFRDPYFPAGPDALGYDQLGPDSEKAKGVKWMRPHVKCGWGPGLQGLREEGLGPGLQGNCWFLAAAASLTLHPRLLHRVVPPRQDFQHGYAGVFHFQLWQFGHWVDVVVDDRLPVREGKLMFVRSEQRNEFWAPLLEKAYAKLHGSYEVMRGGHMNEAFVDFTGGVGEVLYLRQNSMGLFSALRHALAKESLVGATALSDRGEYRTEEGLVKGHAYSVTGTHKVFLGFTKVRLLRLRNPWGRVEWTGAWSDSCPRWDTLPTEWRDALLVKKEDGEFWMELRDFLLHFDTVQICSLSPEVLGPSPAGGGWHVHTFQGRWVRGFNSGGSQPNSETFWTNPQFRLTLLEPDEEEDEDEEGPWGGWGAAGARGPARGCRTPKCTVLLSLIQRNRRRLRAKGLTYLTVGFHVFQITEELLGLWDSPRSRALLPRLLRADRSPLCARRDVSRRCRLRPGHYLVVPSAAHPGDEADFTLRVFSERRHTAVEIDDVISADLQALQGPYLPLELGLEQLFQELAGEEEELGAPQLQALLSIALEPARAHTRTPGEIGLRTCEQLLQCFGHGRSLTLHHFHRLWGHLLEWQVSGRLGLQKETFTDRDLGYHSPGEHGVPCVCVGGSLGGCRAQKQLPPGFHLNNQLTQALTSRYRDSRLRVDFEHFVSCVAQLTCIFCHCSQHLDGGEGVICLTHRQWMEVAAFS
ncbi:calpain-12 [Cebus imitator]|uniref:calpain-12 n=1 Tax=Cebus imitator TaxID=2715852 RepID=UPI000809CF29|nr:calpain-12 [Cebus imitator]